MKRRERIVTGIDIGTTKVCVMIGEIREDLLAITGIGTHPSRGIKKGRIIDIEGVVESIRIAVEDAELMADREVRSAYVSVGGGHVESITSRGMVTLKSREVTESDVVRAIDYAKAVHLPPDREIIHLLPMDFIIDGQPGIKEPIGMFGIKLEVDVHIVTGATTAVNSIYRCCEKVGIEVEDLVVKPIASAEAVISPEEKEIGVVLVDIGGGTTGVAVFYDGSLKRIAEIDVGGNYITRDIAIGLKTQFSCAEKLKREYGHADPSAVRSDEVIEIPDPAGRSPKVESRKKLAEIIEARVEDIFGCVKKVIDSAGSQRILGAQIVLTGGTALLPGIVEVAERFFGMAARVGTPAEGGGLADMVNNPMNSACAGLILLGAKSKTHSAYAIRAKRVMPRNFRSKIIEFLRTFQIL